MSYRTLVLVSGLTVGDYLLWNWSLNANHEVIALVSGLTLPPLALLSLWLIAVAVARLLARTASRPAARARQVRAAQSAPHSRPADVEPVARQGVKQHPGAAGSGSRKIAA